MILDELTLHDFGTYGGRQTVVLTPESPDRPIVLFGALNGGGKTTLLDALQLCFFGNMAQCASRGDLAYDEFLRRSVHRSAGAREASIEVVFRHTVDGREHKWHLTRSWIAGENVKERFQVYCDDVLDKVASEQWSTQVEQFIPVRIAPLFLFDGEKVERYADLEAAPSLIRTAVQNLLGLDVVERLGADLATIERKRRAGMAEPADAAELEGLKSEIDIMSDERSKRLRERASCENEIDRLKRRLSDLEHRYETEGGPLYQDRSRLESELAAAHKHKETLERAMRELAAGVLPLALVGELVSEVARQADCEADALRSDQTASVLAREYDSLLNLKAFSKLPDDVLRHVRDHLDARVVSFRTGADVPRYLHLDQTATASLHTLDVAGLAESGKLVGDLLADHGEASSIIDRLNGLIAAVPSLSSVASLLAERDEAKKAKEAAETLQLRRDEELATLDGKLEAARAKEARLLEKVARAHFEVEDNTRLVDHSSKVRATLEKFRLAVIGRHVERIEGFVFDSFAQLARKSKLITGLRIDPVTFAITLSGADGTVQTAERLSAGERQLLAIAILWGLAKASGRPLPVVIDTPLGRLDSEHRARLVTNYFPCASHQMLLLSTDQELVGDDLTRLMASVGRTYHLRYDERSGRTIIEDGYFQREAA